MYRKCTVIFKNVNYFKKSKIFNFFFSFAFWFYRNSIFRGKLQISAIALLVVITGLFSIWSFYEGLGKNMTLASIILPMLYTLGVGMFWFLIPSNLYTRFQL